MSHFTSEEDEGEDLTEFIEVPDDESVGVQQMDSDNEDDNANDDENDADIYDDEQGPVEDNSCALFKGHSDSVYCAAVHPLKIPRLVLTGGGDDKAFMWLVNAMKSPSLDNASLSTAEIPQLTCFTELKGHTDTVTNVGFNFDGTLAFTGSYDGSIRIWRVPSTISHDQTTMTPACVIDGGPEDIEWAEWHQKGNAIVAGSSDGTVWMWMVHDNASTGVVTSQCLQVFAGHDGAVHCGGFTSDGKFVFTGGDDGTVRVWQPKTGVCRHVFEAHSAMVACCVGSHDGDLLLTGSADGSVALLQISKKRVLLKLMHHTPTTKGDAGKMTSNSSNNNVDMDEEEEGEEGEEVGVAVECVGFAPETSSTTSSSSMKWAASGGMDKTMKIWDLTSGTCRCVCTHDGSVVALRWHTSLPIVCTTALDNVVRVWDARSGSLLLRLSGHVDLVTNIVFAPAISSQRELYHGVETMLDYIVSV
eukprot:CAMPEP_0170066156 /NCGR_PEP_ID=MMETSP0019_2-20121128/5955_1 /TAXON_ID=98059 /ORGANISM="Dinobryon sp., Strain UTEXLB2267" /LENGTH=473 /DNA_ID=CAMNT_0010273167 /DNA_START=1222 /DNA_END=2640 /DNA_ORIENTATION=+